MIRSCLADTVQHSAFFFFRSDQSEEGSRLADLFLYRMSFVNLGLGLVSDL
jgi:hypothetical protein